MMEYAGVVFASSCIPAVFLGCIHIADYDGVHRNDIRSIRRRIVGSSLATAITIIMTWIFLNRNNMTVTSSLGISNPGFIMSLVWPLALTLKIIIQILFVGPLYVDYKSGSMLYWEHCFQDPSNTWSTIRNLVMAPITEELCFRACIMSILSTRVSHIVNIVLSPLFFSLAHFHHIFNHSHSSLSEAFQQCCFQAGFTYLFGVYAAFLFNCTGHISSPIIAHALCNYMGFPDISAIQQLETEHQKRSALILYVLGATFWVIFVVVICLS